MTIQNAMLGLDCSGDKTQLYGSVADGTNGFVAANYISQIVPDYATPKFLTIALFSTLSIAMFKKKPKTSHAPQQPRDISHIFLSKFNTQFNRDILQHPNPAQNQHANLAKCTANPARMPPARLVYITLDGKNLGGGG